MSSGSEFRIINRQEDLLQLRDNYSVILVYGCGKASTLLYKRYGDYLQSFDELRFFQTEVEKNRDEFAGRKIYSCKELPRYDNGNSVVVVATYENIQPLIIKSIKNYFHGRICCLGDVFLGCMDNSNRVIDAKDRGIISVTYADIPNFGDQLNKLLIKKLFGYEVSCEELRYSNLTAIGSLLEGLFVDEDNSYKKNGAAEYDLCIWGSGFSYHKPINEYKTIREKIEYSCLRGYKSKDKIEKYLDKKIQCALGDPGLLVRRFFNYNINKRYSIGIISHYREQELHILKEMYDSYKNAVVINLRNSLELVLEQIAECETVISSSLHGVVVADSFGIPNMLVKISDRPYTDGFRYEDYYSVFGLSGERRDLVSNGLPKIHEIIDNYCVSENMVNVITDDIYKAFPYGRL